MLGPIQGHVHQFDTQINNNKYRKTKEKTTTI
jgi:hypothetical protein